MKKAWEANAQNVFLLKNVVESFFCLWSHDFTVTTLKIFFPNWIIDLMKSGWVGIKESLSGLIFFY